jgi:hypothetical protein
LKLIHYDNTAKKGKSLKAWKYENMEVLRIRLAELTAQQDETPQPPPLPQGGEEGLLPVEQAKDDIDFFILAESHLGHRISLSDLKMLLRSENLSSQSLQMYS